MNPVQQLLDYLTANGVSYTHTPGGAADTVRVNEYPSGPDSGYAEWKFVNTVLESVTYHGS